MKNFLFFLLIIVGSFLSACTGKKTEPIFYGKDVCSHCKMLITDKRFGGEIVTSKGKVYKFDALECQNNFKKEQKLEDDVEQYVVSATENGELIPSKTAYFYEDKNLRSPMGKAYFAAKSTETLKKLIKTDIEKNKDESFFGWDELKVRLQQ